MVSGPPCSGKTTYVAQHSQPGDVIVDYDAIAVALGSPDAHTHPPELRPYIQAARNAALDALIARRSTGVAAWVIASRPSPRETAIAATVVAMETPLYECKRRAIATGRPSPLLRLIDEWGEAETDNPISHAT